VISALVYLQVHSFRNRLVARIKRLKQPKYLAAAIVGGLYFYLYFFRYLFFGPGRQAGFGGSTVAPEYRLVYETVGALVLFLIVLLAWLIPHQRAALAFTETEVAFLFPAPISRRGLIHFKLARTQARILFSVLFLTLVFNRGGNAWFHAAGWWLILSMLNLHFLGSSFTRTLLLDRGVSNWIRRALVIAVGLMLFLFVFLWARNTLPEFHWSDLSDFDAVLVYVKQVLTSGPALYLLYPFRLLTRCYLAPDARAFLAALGPALLIVALHYAWVVYSNVAFEEASVEASQRLADRIATARAGRFQGANKRLRGKRPLFKLAPTGPPAVALLWKNLLGAGQAFTWRIWLVIVIPCVFAYLGLGNNLHRTELFSALAILIGVLLGWSLLLGPQLVRQDLRQDLPLVDVLKTYPLRGWQIVLGEVLAPAVILASAQWLLVIFAAGFVLYARGLRDGFLPFGIAFASLILLPFLDALLLLIPNAAVILFPSWIQTGKEAPRGIEATGQRLIFVLGQLVVFAVALVPAALAFLPVFFLAKLGLGVALAVPLSSLAAAAVLAVETVLGLKLLGRWFERFDLSMELGQP
jgi:Putative ABC exporter